MIVNHQNVISQKDKQLAEYQKQVDNLQKAENELTKQIEEQKAKNNVSWLTREIKFNPVLKLWIVNWAYQGFRAGGGQNKDDVTDVTGLKTLNLFKPSTFTLSQTILILPKIHLFLPWTSWSFFKYPHTHPFPHDISFFPTKFSLQVIFLLVSINYSIP